MSHRLHRRRISGALAVGAGLLTLGLPAARAHHGWSSFDLNRPIWLSGKARRVAWRNPHAELELELEADLKVPADLSQRRAPSQVALVDAARLFGAAQVPTRKDKVWQVELAPITRMQAWQVPEIAAGDALSVLGFTFAGEKGEAILRAEYLFFKGSVYGLRSSPG
jgi:hypothetical protein